MVPQRHAPFREYDGNGHEQADVVEGIHELALPFGPPFHPRRAESGADGDQEDPRITLEFPGGHLEHEGQGKDREENYEGNRKQVAEILVVPVNVVIKVIS